ncbi:MAG TPA: aminopeptidase [Gaiellales bacterium]|jgi:aminopeptidase|nr:aminopeptidase [Gaiellales bacterium]
MTDPRIRRLADVIVNFSVELKEGDLALIHGPALAEPLLVELVRAATAAGAVARLRPSVSGTDEAYLARASDAQLDHLPPWAIDEMDAIDARISVHAAWNTRELTAIDPSRIARRSRAAQPVMARFMERSASGELRWCVTAFPCEAFAQDAGMSLDAYADFVFRAGWLHIDDPVAAWKAYADRLGALAERMSQVRTLRVVGEDTDLTVGVAGRTWIAAKGDRNFPDGEVFTGPVETETSGDVRFSFPAVMGGREVEDVRLRFEGGRVVRSEAASGREYLEQMLAMDDGASILGEFAIGTNYAVEQFTKQILFDEKIGGTCHMAVGAGYPDTGSVNVSGLHWDMVCDLRRGGEIHADGEPIYRDGRFLPSFFDGELSVPA